MGCYSTDTLDLFWEMTCSNPTQIISYPVTGSSFFSLSPDKCFDNIPSLTTATPIHIFAFHFISESFWGVCRTNLICSILHLLFDTVSV